MSAEDAKSDAPAIVDEGGAVRWNPTYESLSDTLGDVRTHLAAASNAAERAAARGPDEADRRDHDRRMVRAHLLVANDYMMLAFDTAVGGYDDLPGSEDVAAAADHAEELAEAFATADATPDDTDDEEV